jgi:hypothetical protein
MYAIASSEKEFEEFEELSVGKGSGLQVKSLAQ